ncbi:MAG: hypothetical protein WC867_00245 [Candidatus Pacearchaeota archaeon]|jgi:KH domain-containing protein
MQQIYVKSIGKLLSNKNKIAKELGIKISNRGREVFINGDAEKEYIGLKVLEAIDLGFTVEEALLLKNEEVLLQILNIRDLTKRKDLHEVRARIIGTFGKTISNLENLSNCFVALKDNNVGIIGDAEEIDETILAIKSIIQGSKQANVYARLEREKKKKRVQKLVAIKDDTDEDNEEYSKDDDESEEKEE